MTMALDARVARLARSSRTINKVPVSVVPDFGVFIDTHRDYPHIGTFADDLHRGMARPTPVDLIPDMFAAGTGSSGHMTHGLVNEAGLIVRLHEKHLFLDTEWYTKWLTGQVIMGENPLDENGEFPTALLRDPRKGIYLLRSFRQMAMERWRKEGSP